VPFSRLGLFSSLARGAQAMGYTEPTPIQLAAIPAILAGRDLVASAQTGTGKTAAFALPILNRLGPGRPTGPRVLVLEPTRELACQVEAAFRQLGRFTDLKTLVLHGGVSPGPQRSALRAGADIVVGTPGRLLEFLETRMLRLDAVEVLVIDEVDRMLDMGFIEGVKEIVGLCPKARQTLLFSATVPARLGEVARFALRDPLRIEIGGNQPVAAKVEDAIHPVASAQKFELLLTLLAREEFRSVIVFTRTRIAADRLAHALRLENLAVAVLHADRSQAQRAAALEQFRLGRKGILVATNLAARGIDVAGVSHVINFEVPEDPEDYVHRIGRTGRAEAFGTALTLAAPEEAGRVHAIEALIGRKIPRLAIEGFAHAQGSAPVIDSSKASGLPHHAGRQRLGAGGQQRGEPGRHQSRARSGPAHGGGHPVRHPKGKPGGHWRRGAR
jgi:ATP-dependent RNA helicase RhlE